MKIEIGKKYRTMCGKPVRILCDDLKACCRDNRAYRFLGLIDGCSAGEITVTFNEGGISRGGQYHLEEVPENEVGQGLKGGAA